MEIDIYIKEAEGSREIRIPWLPDSISYHSNGARMASYEILDVGEVVIPSGNNLVTIVWSSSFPGEGHKNLPFIRGAWQEPKKINDLLEEWRKNGTPLRILMTGTPINHDVYIEDYSSVFEAGYGDYRYDISLKQKKNIKIVSSKVAKPATTTKTSAKTHTVKSGDTLWAIARKYLGSGAKYGTIYNLNKTVIEQTAKKHGKTSSNGGHWIYPGTVLQLPGGSTSSSASSSSSSASSSNKGSVNNPPFYIMTKQGGRATPQVFYSIGEATGWYRHLDGKSKGWVIVDRDKKPVN